MVRTGKPCSMGSGRPFIATASIASRSSVRTASGVAQRPAVVRGLQDAVGLVAHAQVGQQVRDAYAAPAGVADQAAADLVAHAVEGDPRLGHLARDQVGVGQRQLAVDETVDPQRPLLRLDGRLRDGRVDQVEVLVGRLPGRDARHPEGRRRRRLPAGDARDAEQPAAGLDMPTTGTDEAAGDGDPHRGHRDRAGDHQEHPSLVRLELGTARPRLRASVRAEWTVIQVSRPTITGSTSTGPAPRCTSTATRPMPARATHTTHGLPPAAVARAGRLRRRRRAG